MVILFELSFQTLSIFVLYIVLRVRRFPDFQAKKVGGK